MAIPRNIRREDVIAALRQADEEPWPNTRNAKNHVLLHNDKPYPVKYILSLASKYAGNGELPYFAFISSESRARLRDLGFTIVSRSSPDGVQPQRIAQAATPATSKNMQKAPSDRHAAPKGWFWEGNVAKAIAARLESEGWAVDSMADTFSKERGVDIEASKNGRILLIEVKGYPSSSYRDPKRNGEKKRTHPSNQAQHWYSQALLKTVRLKAGHPEALVAMGLPDFPRYRKLFEETKSALRQAGIIFCTVFENGHVQERESTEIFYEK